MPEIRRLGCVIFMAIFRDDIVIAGDRANGRQVKVYDDARRPRDWNLHLKPWQCAVFFRRADGTTALSADGVPFERPRDATFLLFDSFESARAFGEASVERHPGMCCEIFDDAGKAKPALMVISKLPTAKGDVSSASASPLRKILAIALIVGALPLFWWDWHTGGWQAVPSVIGVSMIFAALRFLHWNVVGKDLAAEQKKRVEEHLRREGLREGEKNAEC